MTEQEPNWKDAYYEQGMKLRAAKNRIEELEISNAELRLQLAECKNLFFENVGTDLSNVRADELGEAGMAVPSADSRAQAG